MARKVLILTEPGDIHAYAVAEALRLKGGIPFIWHTADFPSIASESVLFQGSERKLVISMGGGTEFPELANPSLVTIWHRRPAFAVDPSSLHPADVQFAEMECTVFRRSLLSIIARDAFWVNPPDSAISASRKLVQHQVALEVGFKLPDTLYSNDPKEIRAFIRGHGGTIIYKPFRGQPWRSRETYWVPYTSLLSEDQLVPEVALRNAPGIYQELIPKAYELRVTVMGSRLFAAKILSQETQDGKVDWRKAYTELQMQPFSLPAAVAELCHKLLQRLGLVFGCLDFIVTPAGECVFLEINEMGQFLFVEKYTDLLLLDAFSEFLLQGRIDFDWQPVDAKIRYTDILPRVEGAAILSKQQHVSPVEQSFPEDQQET